MKSYHYGVIALIGAGLLAYAGGDPGTGDTLLRDAEKAQRDLESQVQAALARARGESVGEGYRFVGGKYISQREFRLAQRVKELESKVLQLESRESSVEAREPSPEERESSAEEPG